MTKKYNCISLEDYYVVVDGLATDEDYWFTRDNKLIGGLNAGHGMCDCQKVIASIGKRIGDLPLIEIPEEWFKYFESSFPRAFSDLHPNDYSTLMDGFMEGYKAATKTYSLEDMKTIFYVGVQLGINQSLALEGNGNIKLQNEEEVAKRVLDSRKKSISAVELELEQYSLEGEELSSIRKHIRLKVSETNTITPINIIYGTNT